MDDGFVRQTLADANKPVDAEIAVVGGLTVYRPRTVVPLYVVKFEYDGSNNLIYIGHAAPGTVGSAALWRIRKFTYDGSGNLLEVAWPSASREFTFVWDNRASFSYS